MAEREGVERFTVWTCAIHGRVSPVGNLCPICKRECEAVATVRHSDCEQAERRAANWKRRAESADRGRNQAVERQREAAAVYVNDLTQAHDILAAHGLEGAESGLDLAHWTLFAALNWLDGSIGQLLVERDAAEDQKHKAIEAGADIRRRMLDEVGEQLRGAMEADGVLGVAVRAYEAAANDPEWAWDIPGHMCDVREVFLQAALAATQKQEETREGEGSDR